MPGCHVTRKHRLVAKQVVLASIIGRFLAWVYIPVSKNRSVCQMKLLSQLEFSHKHVGSAPRQFKENSHCVF